MCEVLKKRDFTTAAETHWAWANGAEDTFKAILTEAKVDLGTARYALQSIPAGKLRRLRSKCKALREVPDLSAASHTSLALATIPQGSAGPAVSTRLSTCDREKRRKDIMAKYPSHIITGATLPSMGYLQAIHTQSLLGMGSVEAHPERRRQHGDSCQEEPELAR